MIHQPVPIIDLAAAETHSEGLDRLDAACRDHGFFIVSNHGIDPEIERMWEASRTFFAQSHDAKRRVARTQSMPLGYYDRELTKRKRDLKEVFDYMRPSADGKNLNQWPEDDGFKAALSSFFESASEIADRVLKLVFLALEQDHDEPQPLGDPGTSLAPAAKRPGAGQSVAYCTPDKTERLWYAPFKSTGMRGIRCSSHRQETTP